jgi:hypothetical protein
VNQATHEVAFSFSVALAQRRRVDTLLDRAKQPPGRVGCDPPSQGRRPLIEVVPIQLMCIYKTLIFNGFYATRKQPESPGTHSADSPSSADECLDQPTAYLKEL